MFRDCDKEFIVFFFSFPLFILFYVHQKTTTTATNREQKRQDEDDRGERKKTRKYIQANLHLFRKLVFFC